MFDYIFQPDIVYPTEMVLKAYLFTLTEKRDRFGFLRCRALISVL